MHEDEQPLALDCATEPGLPGPVVFPMSMAQQRLWLIEQLEPGRHAYHVPLVFRLRGSIDPQALEHALNEIIARHEVLRTTFGMLDGEPKQIIAPLLRLAIPTEDLSILPADQRERESLSRVGRHVKQHFNLRHGPLLRAALLRHNPRDHILVLVMHHIISDGWSTRVMLDEWSQLYRSAMTGRPAALPELPIQYADCAQWQRETLAGDRLGELTRYWKTQLRDAPALELPLDHHRPSVLTGEGDTFTLLIPDPLRQSLLDLAREQHATLFMVLLAGFKVLLSRHCGQMDVVVGTPTAGRPRSELDSLIGFFANMLVLRTDLGGDPTFTELVARVRKATLDGCEHDDLPFEKLVEELHPRRDRSRHPLFQIAFLHSNGPPQLPDLPGVEAQAIPVELGTSKFDLLLATSNRPDGLQLNFEYSKCLFDVATIQSMAQQLHALLQGIAADPTQKLSLLPLLSPPQRELVLHGFNDTTTDYPRDQTIHGLFAAQATQTPDAPAVVDGPTTLTYRQLAGRAEGLAAALAARGVGQGDRVAICMHRSADLIASLVAILRCGAVYVPLDPDYPADRLRFMLEDAGACLVLHDHTAAPELLAALKQQSAYKIAFASINDLKAASNTGNTNRLPRASSADDLAYLMFTSGSTGVPKAVAVPHRAVIRLVRNTNYFPFEKHERFLLLAPVSFDASTFEIWGPLLGGAVCVVYPHQVPQLDLLESTIRQERITCLWLTSALFNTVIDRRPTALRSLKTLLIGGEALSPEHVRHALSMLPNTTIINGYGPTENTTFTCTHQIPRDLPATVTSVPIGRPIANTRVYVLDDHRQPLPVGVPGELWIGGDGLAHGYWNRPQLTAERFAQDPFSDQPGAKMYRSGDRCRWRADGTIEFLGRLDDQVKIRGYRIEPGEISEALTTHPAVMQSIVVVNGQGAERRLVAYVVPLGEPPKSEDLLQHLKQILPACMIPSAFVFISSIPLTPAGKVDRTALPPPIYAKARADDTATEPRSPIERELVELWSQMLGIDHVGVHDSFFDLGGHSLAAVAMFDQISRRFAKTLPLATLFDHPTIAELALLLRDDREVPKSPIVVPLKSTGTRPPFFCVHGIGGDLFFLKALVQEMPEDQPFYGIRAMGTDEREKIETDIPTMARTYIQAMRQIQPRGPYAIGGFSSGGTIAYEMAKQLEAVGERVSLVAVFDHAPFNLGPGRSRWHPMNLARWVCNLPFYLMDDVLRPARQGRLLSRIIGKCRLWRDSFKRPDRAANKQEQPLDFQAMFGVTSLSDHRKRFLQAHYDALRQYHPQPFGGRITLFRARSRPLFQMNLPETQWRKIAKHVEVHVVPGSHEGMFMEPHVAHLARRLAECLRNSLVA